MEMTNNEIELALANRLIDDILAGGYQITVDDGEEHTLLASTDKAAILEHMQTTDEDRLWVIKDGESLGWFWLIWGNGIDLLSDYAGPPEIFDQLMQGMADLADTFE